MQTKDAAPSRRQREQGNEHEDDEHASGQVLPVPRRQGRRVDGVRGGGHRVRNFKHRQPAPHTRLVDEQRELVAELFELWPVLGERQLPVGHIQRPPPAVPAAGVAAAAAATPRSPPPPGAVLVVRVGRGGRRGGQDVDVDVQARRELRHREGGEDTAREGPREEARAEDEVGQLQMGKTTSPCFDHSGNFGHVIVR